MHPIKLKSVFNIILGTECTLVSPVNKDRSKYFYIYIYSQYFSYISCFTSYKLYIQFGETKLKILKQYN